MTSWLLNCTNWSKKNFPPQCFVQCGWLCCRLSWTVYVLHLIVGIFSGTKSFAKVLWFFPTSTLLVQVTLSKEAVLLRAIGFWRWDNMEVAEKNTLFLRVEVKGRFWCSKSLPLKASVYNLLPLSENFPTPANSFYFFVFVTWWNDAMISIVFRYLKWLLSFRRTSFVFLSTGTKNW